VPEGPEMEPFNKMRHEFEKEKDNMVSTIQGSTSIEPIHVDLEGKQVENLLEEVVTAVESEFFFVCFFFFKYKSCQIIHVMSLSAVLSLLSLLS
jgi:hypothetical protein